MIWRRCTWLEVARPSDTRLLVHRRLPAVVRAALGDRPTTESPICAGSHPRPGDVVVVDQRVAGRLRRRALDVVMVCVSPGSSRISISRRGATEELDNPGSDALLAVVHRWLDAPGHTG